MFVNGRSLRNDDNDVLDEKAPYGLWCWDFSLSLIFHFILFLNTPTPSNEIYSATFHRRPYLKVRYLQLHGTTMRSPFALNYAYENKIPILWLHFNDDSFTI